MDLSNFRKADCVFGKSVRNSNLNLSWRSTVHSIFLILLLKVKCFLSIFCILIYIDRSIELVNSPQWTRENHPSHLFRFKITEAIAVHNLEQIAQFINALEHLSCNFTPDVFGKGISFLSYLKNLPVDYLEFDGSFIKKDKLQNFPRDSRSNPSSRFKKRSRNCS